MKKVIELISQAVDWVMTMYEQSKGVVLVVILGLVSMTGVVLFLWGTASYGIGIRSDSVDYLWSAKNLALGIGLGTMDAFGKLKIMNHFPPLYPVLLSPFEMIGIPAVVGARWFGAVLFGLLIILSGLILYRLCGTSFWFPTIGILVLFFNPDLWSTTLYAMTESLYLICSLTGLLCLDNYFLRKKRRWMLLASVMFGMAFLTRYIGISVIAAGLLYLLLRRERNIKSRVVDILLMTAITTLPMVGWLIRNYILSGSATNRVFTFVPISMQELKSSFDIMLIWINPIKGWDRLKLLCLVIFVIAAISAALIFTKTHSAGAKTTGLPILLGIIAGLYAVFVLVAKLLGDPTIPLNEVRILFPFLLCLFFLLLYTFSLLQRKAQSYSVFAGSLLVGGYFLLAGGILFGKLASIRPYIQPLLVSKYNGLGLQNTSSSVVGFTKKIDGLPADTIYLTDDTQRLYFYAGKYSSYIGDLTPMELGRIQVQFLNQDIAEVFFSASQETIRTDQHLFPRLDLIYQDSSGRSIYFGKIGP